MINHPRNQEDAVARVCQMLRADIVEGRVQVGDRLPSEQALSERFSISPETIQAALRQLQQWRLVTLEPNSVVRVNSPLDAAGVLVLPWLLAPGGLFDEALFSDLVELRVGWLRHTAEMAAENATEQDLIALCVVVDKIDTCRTPEQIQAADFEFFETLVAASGNQAATLFSVLFRTAYDANPERWVSLYPKEYDTLMHRAVVQAIADHDPQAAGESMKTIARIAMLARRDNQRH